MLDGLGALPTCLNAHCDAPSTLNKFGECDSCGAYHETFDTWLYTPATRPPEQRRKDYGARVQRVELLCARPLHKIDVERRHPHRLLDANDSDPRVTAAHLRAVKVLWRQPDCLALWGIPYDMREGQSPYHIVRGRVEARDRYDRSHWASKSITPSPSCNPIPQDWIWLGQPNWWGHYVTGSPERLVVETWLGSLPKDAIPGNPFEWSRLAEWEVGA